MHPNQINKMKIKSIAVKNVRGIQDKKFAFDILPNKPTIFVAPNGFGKSSIAIAFESLNAKRLKVDEDNLFKGDKNNLPELTLEVVDDELNSETLVANSISNGLTGRFSVYVIRNAIKPKATKLKIGGQTIVKTSLELNSIPLLPLVAKSTFDYNISEQKENFGINSKVLPNIKELLTCGLFIQRVSELDLDRLKGKRVLEMINSFVYSVNDQSGSKNDILQWIDNNHQSLLDAVPILQTMVEMIQHIETTEINSPSLALLAVLQIYQLFMKSPKSFRDACNYTNYQSEKSRLKALLGGLYKGWANVKIEEDKENKQLILRFPRANNLSNGQRDFLSLVFAFERARNALKGNHCIIVIDEIFDYLDDANLIAFQYFLTNLIEEFKANGRELFIILLTHLDPALFHHFCFNGYKLKTYYLDLATTGKANDTLKLIQVRDAIDGAGDILDADYFHFNPNPQSHAGQFAALKLKLEWEEPSIFKNYVLNELKRYLQNKNFDPLAVCFAVRITIEEKVFNLISASSHKSTFVSTHKTTSKLDYAASLGIDVPEIYFLLGIIYNDGLHGRVGRDSVSPILTKLKHPVIQHLVSTLVSPQANAPTH
jgi:hypothetical protein